MAGGVVLVPFAAADAQAVSSWARTDLEVAAWCGASRAPVAPDVIVAWGDETGVEALALREDGRLVGYGELWVDEGEREVELARLIVDPLHRGRGLGRRLADRLARRARRIHERVFLRVRPDNAAALRCYVAAGFRRVPPAEEARWNVGQPRRYAWMVHEAPSPS